MVAKKKKKNQSLNWRPLKSTTKNPHNDFKGLGSGPLCIHPVARLFELLKPQSEFTKRDVIGAPAGWDSSDCADWLSALMVYSPLSVISYIALYSILIYKIYPFERILKPLL